jgi:hypothetical protein
MWLKSGRSMGPSALVGVAALIAIEYAVGGGRLTARPASPDPTFYARLARGPCLGSCPDYSVDIDAAGDVHFLGAQSATGPGVPCQGWHRWNVGPAAAAGLEAKVDASGFFGLEDAYRATITDLPTFTVTITRGGRTKTVVDYIGVSVGMPRAMVDLENAIDRAANDRACVVSPKATS